MCHRDDVKMLNEQGHPSNEITVEIARDDCGSRLR